MNTTWSEVELQWLEFSQDRNMYRAQYDQETFSAEMAVVDSLSTILDVDPVELSPLQYSVDVEALNEVVQSTTDAGVDVSFAFEGREITVSTDGIVEVGPTHGSPTGRDSSGCAH